MRHARNFALVEHAAAHRWRLFWVLICQCVQTLAALLIPLFSSELIDRGVALHDTPLMLQLGGWMLLAALAPLGFSLMALALGARIAMDFGSELRRALFAHVHSLEPYFMPPQRSQSLTTGCSF